MNRKPRSPRSPDLFSLRRFRSSGKKDIAIELRLPEADSEGAAEVAVANILKQALVTFAGMLIPQTRAEEIHIVLSPISGAFPRLTSMDLQFSFGRDTYVTLTLRLTDANVEVSAILGPSGNVLHRSLTCEYEPHFRNESSPRCSVLKFLKSLRKLDSEPLRGDMTIREEPNLRARVTTQISQEVEVQFRFHATVP
jgi:hypothetical protein